MLCVLAVHAAWGPGTRAAVCRGLWLVGVSKHVLGQRLVLRNLESRGVPWADCPLIPQKPSFLGSSVLGTVSTLGVWEVNAQPK